MSIGSLYYNHWPVAPQICLQWLLNALVLGEQRPLAVLCCKAVQQTWCVKMNTVATVAWCYLRLKLQCVYMLLFWMKSCFLVWESVCWLSVRWQMGFTNTTWSMQPHGYRFSSFTQGDRRPLRLTPLLIMCICPESSADFSSTSQWAYT